MKWQCDNIVVVAAIINSGKREGNAFDEVSDLLSCPVKC